MEPVKITNMSENQNHNTPGGIVFTVLSWLTVTLTITIQDIDVYLRILCSLIAIATGILGGINWYWSIKKNKKIAKRDIPF